MNRTIIAQQNETISHVCWRVYGNAQGKVEAVLNANPRLCELPPLLPAGTVIQLPPEINQSQAVTIQTINLWD